MLSAPASSILTAPAALAIVPGTVRIDDGHTGLTADQARDAQRPEIGDPHASARAHDAASGGDRSAVADGHAGQAAHEARGSQPARTGDPNRAGRTGDRAGHGD